MLRNNKGKFIHNIYFYFIYITFFLIQHRKTIDVRIRRTHHANASNDGENTKIHAPGDAETLKKQTFIC